MSIAQPWRTPCVVTSSEKLSPSGDAQRDLHRRVCASIEANLGDERLGVAWLLRVFAVSRSTLYRSFGGAGGVRRYIRRRRLERARSYLAKDPACSITWLLYELGFSSDRQFQRAFQACYGISPAQWRQSCRNALTGAKATGRRSPSPTRSLDAAASMDIDG